MKTVFRIFVPLLLLLNVSLCAQVSLQNFSSVVNANTFFYGTWELNGDAGGTTSPNSQFSQGSGVYNITGTGVTNADTSKVDFFNASPGSIGSNVSLSVTAQALSGNAASSFTVILFDTGGKSASASFAASSFPVGSYSTAIQALTFQSGFNSTSIDSIRISGGQPSGTSAFSFSFDDLTAVPEPSTYAAILGAVCLGVVIIRKRRAAVAA